MNEGDVGAFDSGEISNDVDHEPDEQTRNQNSHHTAFGSVALRASVLFGFALSSCSASQT